MKYLKQLVIILAVSFAGELLAHFVPLPIPASIYGLVLLFALLCTGVLKVADVSDVGRLLLDFMPVMFIPAAVGILGVWDKVKAAWPLYLLLLMVSTLAVMAVSGRVTERLMRRLRAKEEGELRA